MNSLCTYVRQVTGIQETSVLSTSGIRIDEFIELLEDGKRMGLNLFGLILMHMTAIHDTARHIPRPSDYKTKITELAQLPKCKFIQPERTGQADVYLSCSWRYKCSALVDYIKDFRNRDKANHGLFIWCPAFSMSHFFKWGEKAINHISHMIHSCRIGIVVCPKDGSAIFARTLQMHEIYQMEKKKIVIYPVDRVEFATFETCKNVYTDKKEQCISTYGTEGHLSIASKRASDAAINMVIDKIMEKLALPPPPQVIDLTQNWWMFSETNQPSIQLIDAGIPSTTYQQPTIKLEPVIQVKTPTASAIAVQSSFPIATASTASTEFKPNDMRYRATESIIVAGAARPTGSSLLELAAAAKDLQNEPPTKRIRITRSMDENFNREALAPVKEPTVQQPQSRMMSKDQLMGYRISDILAIIKDLYNSPNLPPGRNFTDMEMHRKLLAVSHKRYPCETYVSCQLTTSVNEYEALISQMDHNLVIWDGYLCCSEEAADSGRFHTANCGYGNPIKIKEMVDAILKCHEYYVLCGRTRSAPSLTARYARTFALELKFIKSVPKLIHNFGDVSETHIKPLANCFPDNIVQPDKVIMYTGLADFWFTEDKELLHARAMWFKMQRDSFLQYLRTNPFIRPNRPAYKAFEAMSLDTEYQYHRFISKYFDLIKLYIPQKMNVVLNVRFKSYPEEELEWILVNCPAPTVPGSECKIGAGSSQTTTRNED